MNRLHGILVTLLLAGCGGGFDTYQSMDTEGGAPNGGATSIVTTGGFYPILPAGGGVETGGIYQSGGITGSGGSDPTGGVLPTGGIVATGGVATGGLPPTGGVETGGVPTGGMVTGGIAPTGGVPTGGVPTGGVPTGGVATGGIAPTGGVPTGGSGGTVSCVEPQYVASNTYSGGDRVSNVGYVYECKPFPYDCNAVGTEPGVGLYWTDNWALIGPCSGTGSGGVATGGVATGGIAETGGVPTGGVATGGVATGGVATGGVATGGVATGGSSGIDCNGETCADGLSCCLPWGVQNTYCSPPEYEKYCAPGASSQGLLAECTSPDDCPGTHCCIYYDIFSFPTRGECANCADGAGATWACEVDADCSPGRVCRTNTRIYSGAIKTCRG